MEFVRITNPSNPAVAPILAKYCQSFFCQLRGLMFTKDLADRQGLLLVQRNDSKVDATIHMLFMYMDIAVIWINREYVVVDKALARRWKLAYVPQRPAKYVLETKVTHLSDFEIGDTVRFEKQSADATAPD